MTENVILIGMPGVGKSTVGVVLAKRLGYRFVDSDLVIQEETGKLLYELIREYGTDGFLELENRINRNIKAERSVIATGGSAVYGREAMEHFKENGTVVYLRLSLEQLEDRLGDLDERGVVIKEGMTLQDLMLEREALYEKYSDITVDCDDLLIREVVSLLLEKIRH